MNFVGVNSASASWAQLNAYTSNAWHHFAMSMLNATSRTAYVDGVAGTLIATNITPTWTDMNQSGIGNYTFSGTGNLAFIGSYAFAAFWQGVALSAADILSLSKGASPRLIHPEALVSYARLTGGSSPEPDLILPTGWTLNGAPTESVNPMIFCP